MAFRARTLLAGIAAMALAATMGTPEMVTAADGERAISLYNIHTKETATVVYKKDGKFIDSGLEKVSWLLRDFRRNEPTKMDPALVDLLWEVHHELGSKEPIHIISGYRSRATNEMLRKTVGGQASESRHILGKAADVHFPDVPLKNIRYSALIREKGGVGYYPTSAIPFVHLDTDRVRAWPRLPRYELALLFPTGQTHHQPADGGPLTREDVRVAQARYPDLARQVAAYHEERKTGGTRIAVASTEPAPRITAVSNPAAEPRLVDSPRTAAAPARAALAPKPLFTPPPADDRARLAELAALAADTPRLVQGPAPARRPAPKLPSLSGNGSPVAGLIPAAAPEKPRPQLAAIDPTAVAGAPLSDVAPVWNAAPAFDEEHPDELSYRPFPIAPFLTQSAAEPLMSELLHHDVARTIDMIDNPGSQLPMRFNPGEQTARLMYSQQFTGEAIKILRQPAADAKSALRDRQVRTSQK